VGKLSTELDVGPSPVYENIAINKGNAATINIPTSPLRPLTVPWNGVGCVYVTVLLPKLAGVAHERCRHPHQSAAALSPLPPSGLDAS